MENNKLNCSVVIPVYNSELTLAILYQRLVPVLTNLTDEYEIIFVNDGSIDGSWNEIQNLAKESSFVVAIDLMKNYGQHNAILCGIREVSYEIVITMDDDLQNPPEEIPKLIHKLKEGHDIVYGIPDKMRHGFFRDLASIATKIALKTTMGVENARNVSSFRAFHSYLSKAFKDYKGSLVSIDVLLTWATGNFASTVVEHNYRKISKSNYTFKKLFIQALNMITGFSIVPLQIASLLGIVFSIFGLLVFSYVIIIYLLLGTPVKGFPFIASIICIFSGVQLLAMGIIGEYLSRIHYRSMDRPTYTIKKTIYSNQTINQT